MKLKTIPQNLVLIKPNDDFKSWGIKGIDGEELMIPVGAASKSDPYETEKLKEDRQAQATWDAAQHVSVAGTVLMVPDRLVFNGYTIDEIMQEKGLSLDIAQEISELRARSCEFDVPMVLQFGDTVFFKYIEHFNCFKENRIVEDNFEVQLLMNYHSLIMAIRDGQPIMLNGNILIEPLQANGVKSGISEVGSNGMLKPVKKEIKTRKSQIGVVRYIGDPVTAYLNYPNEEDEKNIRVGDVVIFNPQSAISLEHEYHRTFHVARLVRCQRKDIWMVLGNEENNLDLDKIKI